MTPVARVIEDLRLRLRDLAASSNATARKMALLCLVESGDRDVALYVHALADEDGYVRLAALRALGRLGDASSQVVTALRSMEASDPEDRIRRAAGVIAGRLTAKRTE